MIYNVVNTLVPTFLIGSSSFLQITRTTIKSRMSLNFGQIRPWTADLTAFERLNLLLTSELFKIFHDMLALND